MMDHAIIFTRALLMSCACSHLHPRLSRFLQVQRALL